MTIQPNPTALVAESPAPVSLPADLRYRKLQAADQAAMEAHLLRLEPHDRYLRFWGGAKDEVITAYCKRLDWSATVVIGVFIDGELRGVGELVRVRLVPHLSAEIALSVEGPWQNAGVGTELLRRVLTVARNRFIDRVYMLCLSENKKMQKIARKFDANLTFHDGEVEGRIWPAWPSYLSLAEEAVRDGEAFFNTFFDTGRLWAGLGVPTDITPSEIAPPDGEPKDITQP